MKRNFIAIVLILSANAMASPCTDTSEPEQWVLVTEGVDEFTMWKVNPDAMHELVASNGRRLGVKINPVSADFYRNRFEITGREIMPELVEITVVDMDEQPYTRISHSYGGVNSLQTFGLSDGVSAEADLGAGGVTLLLHKTMCVTLDDLANR